MNTVNNVVNKVLCFIEEKVVAALFAIVTIIVFIQVVFRVAGASLPWSEELARYLNTWTIFFGASRCVYKSKHLSVDLLATILKGKANTIQKIFVDIVCLVFFVYIAFWGIEVLNQLTRFPQHSAALRVNMVYCYAAPVVGTFMMTIRTLQKIYEHVMEMKTVALEPQEGGETA